MKTNQKYQLDFSNLIQIENLLDQIDLDSDLIPTQVRESIIKVKHIIKVETFNLYLSQALSISCIDNNSDLIVASKSTIQLEEI